MELHRLLKRQLEKTNLNPASMPSNVVDWQDFLNAINRTYKEADQERYLLERSMEISSRELFEINGQLERAQHLAGLCYWLYSPSIDLMTWSKGIYELLQLDPLESPPTFQQFESLIHSDDRSLLKINLDKALVQGLNGDFEARIQLKNGRYIWFRLMIKPSDKINELSGIMINITESKESEAKINELNRALLTTARMAGMSEVATTILHNIGNLLNSTNISVAVLKQHMAVKHHRKLSQLIAMLNANREQIQEFLLVDSKGKLILPYLSAMAEMLAIDYETSHEELARLEKNLNHIQDIVSVQKSISGVAGLYEKINLSDLLNNAIEMANMEIADFVLKKQMDNKINTIVSDKSKLLQILTNLLINAKQAVLENKINPIKEIEIMIYKSNESICISVKDNGVGVAPENIHRIFSFGFTTKAGGHGFGLHSSALSAKELGGSLIVHSQGAGKGAEFILTLPPTRGESFGEILHG